MAIHLIVGLIKKRLYKNEPILSETVRSFGRNINVKIDLSNYATLTHVDTSIFALKTNLVSLKSEADKLDIDKLVPVPVDLSKLSKVVKKGF